jgi:kynurenine formamidase
MSRAGTLHLTRQGATILGTDAVGWDLPFGVMAEKFRETGDPEVLWDGHKAIVDREAFIVQQLTNLGALPPTGFMVGFFPMKLARCSAAPARVVAFLD